MEITPKTVSTTKAKFWYLFFAVLFGLLLGALVGFYWRGWLAYPSNPSAGARLFAQIAGWHALNFIGFWHISSGGFGMTEPTSPAYLWMGDTYYRLGRAGMELAYAHLFAVGKCAVAGGVAGFCLLAGLSKKPSKESEKETEQ